MNPEPKPHPPPEMTVANVKQDIHEVKDAHRDH
jgi:hypothetical protein